MRGPGYGVRGCRLFPVASSKVSVKTKRGEETNIMKRIFIVSVLVFLMCRIGEGYGLSDDFEWPRWRGPGGNGISMETEWNPKALEDGPRIVWKVDVGVGHANVAIKENRLYTVGKGVFCLDAETGEKIWQYTDEVMFDPKASPTIDGKYIYVLSERGILLCLKAKNGKLRWRKDLQVEYETETIPYGYNGSPVIVDDLLILNVNTAGIALNKRTGDLVWASTVHRDKKNSYGYHATPVLYNHEGKRNALLLSGLGLASVDPETGKKMWFYEWGQTNTARCTDPIVFDGKVFLSAGYMVDQGTLVEMTGNVPRLVWENGNMGSEFSACVYVDGYLYGSNGDHAKECQLRCIDVNTGEVMWEEEMKMASLTAADGKLIILEENGTLRIAEETPSSYKEISSCDVLEGERTTRVFFTPPVLCNGKIYCRNNPGDLICIDVRK